MKYQQMTLGSGIKRELQIVHDEAVELAKQLGFTGNDRKMLEGTQREVDYYARKLKDKEDYGMTMAVARRGPWMRKFPKPIVSRIFCVAALEVLFDPFELLPDGGFDLDSWFSEIERRITIIRREGPIAVKTPPPSSTELHRIARVEKAKERIRELEHEIAIARSECDCAA